MVNINTGFNIGGSGGINRAPRAGGQDHNMPDPGTTTVEPSKHRFYDKDGKLLKEIVINDGDDTIYRYTQHFLDDCSARFDLDGTEEK